MIKAFYQTALFFVLLFSAVNVFAQGARERGIELYEQGKFAEAIRVLQPLSKAKETKRDASVWNYLGMAYKDGGELKKARKALEKAVALDPRSSPFRVNLAYVYLASRKVNAAQSEIARAIELDPRNFTAYYVRGAARIQEGKFAEALADAERIIGINPNFAGAYTLKSNANLYLFGERVSKDPVNFKDELEELRKAIEPLEYCVKYCKDNPILAAQIEKLDALRTFHDYFAREKKDALSTTPPTDEMTPIKILAKPQARYTDEGRKNNISGTITMYVLFASNGQVSFILPINALGHGLDQQAMKAAAQIRFEPAKRNGVPVSVVKKVTYSFTIY
jgi:TonB family protein